MNKWLQNLIHRNKEKHMQIEEQKSAILNSRRKTINELKQLNKKFRFTIESGQIEVIIKDITEITKNK